jgi:sec-independent protein translocase protein TatA
MHWMIVAAVMLVLFGGGRVSGLMGDLAKGIKTFKKTMADEPKESPVARLPQEPQRATTSPAIEREHGVV